MQIMLAAVRLDIGNVFPNNHLVYPNVLDATISKGGPLYNDLLSTLQYYNTILPILGDASRPAVIASQYLCHFPQRKSLGSAIISILVATLSMFGSAWVAFLFVATYYETRKDRQRDYHLPKYDRTTKDDLEMADRIRSLINGKGEM
ncbi:hypothetical protein FRB93_006931 [Tulasnella sp. JGI-2019a]|nr:hypothetical protein FRB93_006931 [Tulasnella sp. JGI-2019a]